MDKKIKKSGDTEIEKHTFLQHKSAILINNIDINKILVTNKIFFGKNGFKYFIRFKDGKRL